jgi:uncharacterized protein
MSKLSPLSEEFYESGRVEDCPIYDLHGHMGPIYGIHLPAASEEAAVRAMDRANVRMLVFCHHEALLSNEVGNAANIVSVRKFPGRLRAYCGINPNYADAVRHDLETFDDYPDVYVGLKLLPDYHAQPITSSGYQAAWEMADRKSLPVLVHTWGGSPCNGADQVRKAAEQFPGARIIMGHSIHGDWETAIEIVREFPNVYFELTAVLDERGILEKFVEGTGSTRILFGTDFPWFDFHYYIGAVLGASVTDDDRRNIFYRNAERLLGLSI